MEDVSDSEKHEQDAETSVEVTPQDQTLYRPIPSLGRTATRQPAELDLMERPLVAPSGSQTEPHLPIPAQLNVARPSDPTRMEHRVDESEARVPNWMRQPTQASRTPHAFDLESTPPEEGSGARALPSVLEQLQEGGSSGPATELVQNQGSESTQGLSMGQSVSVSRKSSSESREGSGIAATGVSGPRGNKQGTADERMGRQRMLAKERRQKIESRKERITQQNAQELENRQLRQLGLSKEPSQKVPKPDPPSKRPAPLQSQPSRGVSAPFRRRQTHPLQDAFPIGSVQEQSTGFADLRARTNRQDDAQGETTGRDVMENRERQLFPGLGGLVGDNLRHGLVSGAIAQRSGIPLPEGLIPGGFQQGGGGSGGIPQGGESAREFLQLVGGGTTEPGGLTESPGVAAQMTEEERHTIQQTKLVIERLLQERWLVVPNERDSTTPLERNPQEQPTEQQQWSRSFDSGGQAVRENFGGGESEEERRLRQRLWEFGRGMVGRTARAGGDGQPLTERRLPTAVDSPAIALPGSVERQVRHVPEDVLRNALAARMQARGLALPTGLSPAHRASANWPEESPGKGPGEGPENGPGKGPDLDLSLNLGPSLQSSARRPESAPQPEFSPPQTPQQFPQEVEAAILAHLETFCATNAPQAVAQNARGVFGSVERSSPAVGRGVPRGEAFREQDDLALLSELLKRGERNEGGIGPGSRVSDGPSTVSGGVGVSGLEASGLEASPLQGRGRRWLSTAAAEIEDSVLAELEQERSSKRGRQRGPSQKRKKPSE